jgi:hypothetical protein
MPYSPEQVSSSRRIQHGCQMKTKLNHFPSPPLEYAQLLESSEFALGGGTPPYGGSREDARQFFATFHRYPEEAA